MATPDTLREIAQTRVPFSTWLGVVVLFAIFGVIVLATIGPSPRGDDYEQKRAKARQEKLKGLREEESKTLAAYGWIDKTKGTVHVPIERAMELTVADLGQKQPTVAGPIATPAVQASPAPVPAATPKPARKVSPTPTGTPKATTVEGEKSEARGQPAAAVKPPAAPAQSPAASPPQPTPAHSP
jgi:hypothetical protein